MMPRVWINLLVFASLALVFPESFISAEETSLFPLSKISVLPDQQNDPSVSPTVEAPSIFNLKIPSYERPKKMTYNLFAPEAPVNAEFKNELRYLLMKKRLTENEKALITSELAKAEELLHVPKALLWCILFQESRLDSFKNATNGQPAKGLGQFIKSALYEINEDTDQFDRNTSSILKEHISPKVFPIKFTLKNHSHRKSRRNKAETKFPPQPPYSYYNTPTAVFASAAYLQNRYLQLKTSLDRQKISYNPDILWLFAAAAYNKGSRSIFLLLTQQFAIHGVKGVKEVLNNPKASYALLTRKIMLDRSLRKVWEKNTRVRYIKELTRNMEVIASCSLPEDKI